MSRKRKWVWMRLGDLGSYERYDTPSDAGYAVGEYFSGMGEVPISIKHTTKYGIEIDPWFISYNYISLYWGDSDAQPIRELNHSELNSFVNGIKEECPSTRINPKSVTPTYRLEMWDSGGKHVLTWSGRASDSILRRYINAYIQSMKPGGSNYHISKSLGYIPVPNRARLVRQRTGKVVATWESPPFMVI